MIAMSLKSNLTVDQVTIFQSTFSFRTEFSFGQHYTNTLLELERFPSINSLDQIDHSTDHGGNEYIALAYLNE